MYSDGRKIPRNLENPIDNVIIDASERMDVYLRGAGVTPNILTYAAMYVGILAAYFAYVGQFWAAVAFTIVSYFLDCMDGNMARKYGMITSFGDWFDHVSDISKYVLLYLAIALTPNVSTLYKVAFFVVTAALMFMMLIHLGCQERSYNKTVKDSMSAIEDLCKNQSDIRWTRYFGMGTWVFVICVMLAIASAL